MIESGTSSELPPMIAHNPYAPSMQPVQIVDVPAAPSLIRWRVYLFLHLLVVAATAAMTIAERANYYHHNTLHNAIIPWGQWVSPIAVIGFPLALVAPFIVVALLVKAGRFGARYAAAAGMETMLMLAHYFTLLPTVQ